MTNITKNLVPIRSLSDHDNHKLTFELHKKIGTIPKTIHWVPVPEICKLHSIGNTGNPSLLYLCIFACCCEGCLHGRECTNTVCPDSWKGYDLEKKKYVQSDLTFWVQDNLQENNIQVTWEQRLVQISSISNFDDLQEYINSNPLPAFEGSVQQDMTENDKSKLDFVALHHLPQDAPDSFAPISVDGDGNCFPRSVSYILEKHEDRHKEIRVGIVYEAIQNMVKYLDNQYVSIGAQNVYGRATLVKQFFQTANILHVLIQSVYPFGCSDLNTRKDMNRTVYCYNDSNNNPNEIKIMWAPTQIRKQRPCHFVPLLKVVI